MQRIEKARLLFLDSSPIQKLLQADMDIFPVISKVLDVAYEKNLQMVVSPITLHEISYRAYEKDASLLVRQYKEFFTRSLGVALREIDAEIAQVAASFRNKYGLDLGESFQIATAFVSGADAVFTLNEDWNDYLDAVIVTPSSLLLD